MTLSDAIRHLEEGDWQAAHEIVQDDPSPLACWAHGIVHLMEGDVGNAGYWYRRAERRLPEGAHAGSWDTVIAAEVAALKISARPSTPPP